MLYQFKKIVVLEIFNLQIAEEKNIYLPTYKIQQDQ